MSAACATIQPQHRLEVAHVLFMDIVAYSTMRMDRQQSVVQTLQDFVQNTTQFREATRSDELIRLPTGDGMALVFFGDPEAPILCALEVAQALRNQPELKLRMGIHTGPVFRRADINANANVAGGGINIAQRVMDCGDSGHILVSKAVADMVGQVSQWADALHDLGEVEVKHGFRVHLFNLYTNTVGNPQVPEKVQASKKPEIVRKPGLAATPIVGRNRHTAFGAAVLLLSLLAVGWQMFHKSPVPQPNIPPLSEGKYLAVVPFDIGPGDTDALRTAAEHIVTELNTRLSPITDLHTSSRLEVQKLRQRHSVIEIARELGANLILTVSVQGTADRMHTDVVLNKVPVGATRKWERDGFDMSRDLLEVESDIFKGLVSELKVHPSEDATQASPEDLGVFELYRRGQEAMHNPQDVKNVQGAVRWFEKATKKDPLYAQAWGGLADAYLQMYLETRQLEWLTKTRGAAENVHTLHDRNYFDVHVALGRVYDATGEPERALAELRAALKLAPNSDEVYRRLGLVYEHAGKKDDAIRNYQNAVVLNQRYWANYDTLGKAFLRMGDLRKAEEAFQRVVDLAAADNPVGFEGIGNVYYAEGRYKECIPYYERAIKIQPYFATVSNLGTAYFSLGRYEDAVKAFTQAASLNPDHEDVIGNLADAYRWSGQKELALQTYKKAISLAQNDLLANPRDSGALGDMALYYAKLGDVQRGKRLIAKARSIDAAGCDLMFSEAVVDNLARDTQAATRVLKQALRKGCPPQTARADPELRDLWASTDVAQLSAAHVAPH